MMNRPLSAPGYQRCWAQALLHAGALEDPRGRQGQEEVGQVEHHQHQERAHLVQLEGQFDEGDQRAVEPGEEADQEEQHPDDEDRGGHARTRGSSRHDRHLEGSCIDGTRAASEEWLGTTLSHLFDGLPGFVNNWFPRRPRKTPCCTCAETPPAPAVPSRGQ